MKIHVKIEDGAPLLVFPDNMNRDKSIGVYSEKDGHSSASRAYVRKLKAPETEAELLAAWKAVEGYAKIPK